MSGDRITGRLVHSYVAVVPADPGWAQPARHRSDAEGGGIDRDDAPAGGGWQPYGWDTGVNVLPGETYGPAPTHRGDGSHAGELGRGGGRRRVLVTSEDRDLSGDDPGLLLGAGGAANGGLVLTGVSLPFAARPTSRRRADGGVVNNPGGIRLGERHLHPTVEHRQALHFNRPSIRFIRESSPTVSTTRSARPAGPVAPRSRTILRPTGLTSEVAEQTAQASAVAAEVDVIGSDWVR